MWVCFFSNKNKSCRCLFGFPLPKIISDSCQHAYGFLSVFSPHLRNSTSTLCALPQNSRLWSHVIGMTLSIWIISLLQSALLKHIRGVCVVYRSRLLFCLKRQFQPMSFCPTFCAPFKDSHQDSHADRESFFDDMLLNCSSGGPCLFSVFASKLNTRNMDGYCFFCSNSEMISLYISAHYLVCITNVLWYSVKRTRVQGFVSVLIWTLGINTWQCWWCADLLFLAQM